MKKLKNFSRTFWQDESGATAIEYALIAALVGISIIAGASSIGKNTNSLWNGVANAVEQA
ncbi:MAG: Flp family type IVb pilin [Acidimicrobiales bacterium]|nr:Flp family type IVb pilin [Hyphomonadaceae bacterium]RZV40768.1 MAG: Flp family type IVb pilin [Acidimicrobiales bacterium]